jgi:hypothetical protein
MPNYIITTHIGGKRKIITAFSERFNESLIPEYSEAEKEAKIFSSKEEAQDEIIKIHNTYDRIFLIEPTKRKIKKIINHPINKLQ